jgi:hypothetical protein
MSELTDAQKQRRLTTALMRERARWRDVVFVVHEDGEINVQDRGSYPPPPREHALIWMIDIEDEPRAVPMRNLANVRI